MDKDKEFFHLTENSSILKTKSKAKMKKIMTLLSLAVLMVFALPASAQEKKLFTPEDASFTAALLEVIHKSYQQKDYFVTASALDLFLCRIKPREDHPDNAIVSRFLELVFDRNNKPGKVSTYASSLCITPNYLNRLVRAHTGHSAMDWIEISRLNLAKSLLKQNQLQVSEIASAVGIDDQSYFTRFFKKSEGITPTQYRDQILGGLRHSK